MENQSIFQDKLIPKEDKLMATLLIKIHNLLIDSIDIAKTSKDAQNEQLKRQNEQLKLLKLQDEQSKQQNEQLKQQNEQLKQQNQLTLDKILKELRNEADDGGVLRQNGTVTPTQFVIIDTHQAPGHDVKGYTVKNDGPHTIFVAHNAAVSSEVDADIIDVTTDDSRFEEILPNEDVKFVFNRRRIKNIHILAQGGNSQFRVWLV